VSTSTATSAYTSTHTATYLADIILGTLTEAIGQLGLNPSEITRDWATSEAGIAQWIKERSLRQVSIEFTLPSGRTMVIDFNVEYSTGDSQTAAFSASKARISRFLTKYSALPSGTTYRLVANYNGYHTPMPGWGSTHAVKRTGLQTNSAGTLATAPGATAQMNISD